MTKTRTSVTIDKDLLKKAHEMEINVSALLEIRLREYIALIEGKTANNKNSAPPSSPQNNNKCRGLK